MKALLLFLISSIALADSGLEENKLSFCHFGPKIKITNVVIDELPAGNKCAGTAKVQGVLWECGTPDKVDQLVYSYRKNLSQLADEECTRHCEGRSRGCLGRFRPPTACALTVDREDAVALGKKFGCRS